jgi:hypothetical protein
MDEMFDNAIAFNQDISEWNVSSIFGFGRMIYNASSFNQNLCAWGDHICLDRIVDSIFVYTSCASEANPVGSDGPFCAICFLICRQRQRTIG